MKKFTPRTEEIILMTAALIILLTSFWYAIISLVVGVVGAVAVFIYNYLTRES